LVALLEQLEVIERRQEELKGELALQLTGCEEARYLLSVPGVSTITLGRLLGECGGLASFPKAKAVQKFVGLNLYSVTSGQQRGKVRIAKRGRASGRAVLDQAVIGQLRQGGIFGEWAARLRAEGSTGGKLRVAAARRLLEVLFALARDKQYFDRERFCSGARTGDGHTPLHGTQPVAA
jgi:transposase